MHSNKQKAGELMVYYDPRWAGMGGIGRFATEVTKRLPSATPLNVATGAASVFSTLALATAMRQAADHLVFLPGYIPPLFSVTPFVFTIHDLNHVDRPENTSWLKRLFYSIVIRVGCQRASLVFTVSEFSKQRIVDWAGISPNKVVNVGNGVDESFHADVAPWSPGFPYVLCVSNRKLHKNELRLVSAFATAKIDPSIRLVFTGDVSPELLERCRESGVADRVHFVGRVSESLLPQLYRGAMFLAFPSLYEGFGLPVIEAMACGTPVITSTTTSLPEVAGDAALLVDPESVTDIRNAIECLATDASLRQKLRRSGLEQAKLFSWDATARKVSEALERVANEGYGHGCH